MLNQNFSTATTTLCRRAIVAACDPIAVNKGSNPSLVNATPLILRIGDIIDIGLDWSEWMTGNGGGLLIASTWAVNAGSPQSPTLSGSVTLFDPDQAATAVLLDMTAAHAGDVYWIDNTVTIKGAVNGAFSMPQRTITRTLWVTVSK